MFPIPGAFTLTLSTSTSEQVQFVMMVYTNPSRVVALKMTCVTSPVLGTQTSQVIPPSLVVAITLFAERDSKGKSLTIKK